MKKFLRTIFFIAFTCCTTYSWAVVNTIPKTIVPTNQSIINQLDVDAFLSLSPKELAKRTGQKLKLRDRIVLRIAQVQINRKIKKGKAVNIAEDYAASDRRFNIGGFLLGFFFSLLGVLIAILFGKNAVRSALLGALISLVLWVVFGITR